MKQFLLHHQTFSTMNTNKMKLTTIRLNRLRTQGYTCQSDEELSSLAFGNRFAYRACVILLIPGVVLANIPLLLIMMFFAFLGVVLPNHPFDYIYNHLLSKRMKKPQLPPRSVQLKFTCSLATLWIGATAYLFYIELMLAGYILGGLLIGTALLVSTIDLCIPSMIYNSLFLKRVRA